MTKNILVFSTQLMPTGGMESHILSFCAKMSSDGFLIDLVVPNFSMNDTEYQKLKKFCNNVYINRGKLSTFGYLRWMISKGLYLSKKKYQCVYTNGQGNSINLMASLIIKKNNWIHHHHSSGDLTDQKAWSKKYREALLNADTIIACSTKNARDMSTTLKRNIDTIPCFSKSIHRKKSKKTTSKINLGYYGRLIPEKGIETLAQLSNDIDFKDVEFHVWGEGVYDKTYFDNFKNLYYHGAFYTIQALEEIINFLNGFLLISTHREGLPICLLEAMSAGLPWVSTDQGGISDIVCDPNATRLIKGEVTYNKVKATILSFVNDIKNNVISYDKQIEYYKENFSEESLVIRWRNMILKNQ